MDEDLKRQWAIRAVQVVNRVFPTVEHWVTSSQCQRYFPQAQVAITLINAWDIRCVEAGRLLTQFACYLYERKDYELIPPERIKALLQNALAILRQCPASEMASHEMANAQQMLGWVYIDCGKHIQAEQYIRDALAIYEQLLEPDQWSINGCLSNLAEIHERLGNFAQAESLYQRALENSEQLRGPEHVDVLTDLRNLASCYFKQRKYVPAIPLLQRALTLSQNILGGEHLMTASVLTLLGRLYVEQGYYEQAGPLLQQALEIRQQKTKPGHSIVVGSLNALGRLYLEQGEYVQAEALLQQALEIQQTTRWSIDAAALPQILNNLARLYSAQGNVFEARSLFQQAYTIAQENLGPDHPTTAEFREDLTHFTLDK